MTMTITIKIYSILILSYNDWTEGLNLRAEPTYVVHLIVTLAIGSEVSSCIILYMLRLKWASLIMLSHHYLKKTKMSS